MRYVITVIVLVVFGCDDPYYPSDSVTGSIEACDLYDEETGLCWIGTDCSMPDWIDPFWEDHGLDSWADMDAAYEYCDQFGAEIPTLDQVDEMNDPDEPGLCPIYGDKPNESNVFLENSYYYETDDGEIGQYKTWFISPTNSYDSPGVVCVKPIPPTD